MVTLARRFGLALLIVGALWAGPAHLGRVGAIAWAASEVDNAKADLAAKQRKLELEKKNNEAKQKAAQDAMCAIAPTARDCEELKQQWGLILDGIGKGVGIWALSSEVSAARERSSWASRRSS